MKIQDLKHNQDNSRFAQYAISIFTLMLMLQILMNIFDYQVLAQPTIDLRKLGSNDWNHWLIQRFLGIAFLAMLFFFVRWFWIAYRNLLFLGADLSFTSSWAIWGWFIPIINLFRPYKMIEEVWEHQSLLLNEKPNRVLWLGGWWFFVLLTYILLYCSNQYILLPPNLDMLLSYSFLRIIALSAAIPALLMLIVLIKRISAQEKQLYRRFKHVPIEAHLLKGAA